MTVVKAVHLISWLCCCFLLQDYFENDVYSNTEEIIECNGSGEILWDKTINETFTLLSENRPYYTELQTRKRVTMILIILRDCWNVF